MRFRPDLSGLLATLSAVCFWLPVPNLVVVAVLHGSVCVCVCVGRVIAVLRERLFVAYDCIRIHVLYACKVKWMS